MRDAIAWSHDLLSPEEQALFRRLSVFVGGFTIEGAEVVGGGGDILFSAPSAPSAPSVLDGLASLVGKSLVRQVDGAGGEPRFRMLETIREYALERLEASEEADAVRARYAAWALDYSKRVDAELEGPDMFRWLLRVEAEHANLRAAIEWLKQRGESGSALRLGAGLSAFWWYRGHFAEGRAQLEGLLALPDARDHPYAWARAMTGLGALVYKSGGVQRAMALHEQAVAVWQELGDRQRIGYALWCQGLAAAGTDDDLAIAALEEAREIGNAVHNPWLALPAQWALGRLARSHRDYRRAEELVTDALRRARELGHPIGIPLSLMVLGHIALDQGDVDRAGSLLGESLAYLRELGERWGSAGRLKGLAAVAAAPWGVPACLDGLAAVAGARGEVARAARLFGATAALRDLAGYAREPVDQPGFERWIAPVRTALGEAAFAAALVEGQSVPVDDAVADALAIAEALDGRGASAATITPVALTPDGESRPTVLGAPSRSAGTAGAARTYLSVGARGVGNEGERGRIEDGDGEPRRRAAGVQPTAGDRRSGGA